MNKMLHDTFEERIDLSQQKTCYIVVRNDLSDAPKAVQVSHVGLEIGRLFTLDTDIHPKIIIVLIKNKYKMEKLIDDLPFEFVGFRERDLGGEFTAIGTRQLELEERTYFKRYCLL